MSVVSENAKRIPSYLDGMMSESERLDFEALVGSDLEFARLFRQKQIEQESLVQRIPVIESDDTAIESLEVEIQECITNLFNNTDATASTKVKSWFQELF